LRRKDREGRQRPFSKGGRSLGLLTAASFKTVAPKASAASWEGVELLKLGAEEKGRNARRGIRKNSEATKKGLKHEEVFLPCPSHQKRKKRYISLLRCGVVGERVNEVHKKVERRKKKGSEREGKRRKKSHLKTSQPG